MYQKGRKEEENISLTSLNLQNMKSEDAIKRGKKYKCETIT